MATKTKKIQPTSGEKQKKPSPSKINYLFFYVVSAIGILTGLIFGWNLKWVGDDTFIGLRYIDNLLAGNGLVYNVGERIEGYTNFSWVMLLTFFHYLKFDPVETSLNLGLIFSLGTLLVVAFISFKINAGKGLKYFVPLSMLMLAFNFDFGVWATGGLETMLYAFLLISPFGVYFFMDSTRNKRLFICGLLLCLALLTRPDAAMFFGLANIFLLIRNIVLKIPFKRILTEQLLFSSSVILIYIPYFIWRYNYYGQIFPNTYYSKAGYLSFYSRGFYYLWTYFQVHFTTFLFFLSIPVLLRIFLNSRSDSSKSSLRERFLTYIGNNQLSAFTVAVISVSLYLVFFVAKVGGDFMYARFVIPCLPFICFAIEYSLYALPEIKFRQRYWLITLAILGVVVAESVIREDFFLVDENGKKTAKEKEGIADERYVYVYQYKLEVDKKIGMALQPYFKDLDATVLVRGGQACFVYYGKFKYCLENHGLTDTVISHQVIAERGGKIAHEKSATYEYMIKKGVDFVFRRSAYKTDRFRFAQFNLGGMSERAEIICYDRKLINVLKERMGADFMYTDFEAYLDNYIQKEMPAKSKADLKKDYQDFKEYYFLHNNDTAREQPFLDKLKG